MRSGTSSEKVIKVCLGVFARFGLPDVLVTDGGPPFNSEVFVKNFERQGICVLKSPPYHPESNGQAERIVRLVKDVLKVFFFLDPEIRKQDIETQIYYFLFNYRNICLGVDGEFPSEKLLSYKPKTTLDLINPKNNFKNNQTKVHDTENKNTDANDIFRATNLKNGDMVYYRNPNKTEIRKFLPATFLKQISTNVFQISIGGRVVSAHKRQLKVPSNVSRKVNRKWVLQEGTSTMIPHHSTSGKRRRPKEFSGSEASDSDGDFYGFPSDSFIFKGEDPPTFSDQQVSSSTVKRCIRTLKRKSERKSQSLSSVATVPMDIDEDSPTPLRADSTGRSKHQ